MASQIGAVAAIGVDSDSGDQRLRRLSGPMAVLARVLTIALALYILAYISTALRIFDLTLYGSHRALTYSIILFLAYLYFPASAKGPWQTVPWYDLLLGAAGFAASLYAFVSWDDWLSGVGIPTRLEEGLGIVLILVTLEASRRSLGLAFTLVAVAFIVYPVIGQYMPGVLRTQSNSLSAMVQNFYFAGTSNGIFGSPMEIFTTTVAVFLLFGAFLTVTGAAKLFLDGAMGVAGRYRAGMAKVAVISSALFGTISGVGAANVLVTGSFTIPAMKRLGYRPALAGAVEATASTGGLLMPPVMGAAAFLMADILSISYWEIAVAAFLPALLYYLAIFIMVDFEGGRDGLKGVPEDEIPPLMQTLRSGWYLIVAIAVLLILLGGFSLPVDQSAFGALATLVVLAAARPGGLRFKGFFKALEDGGRLLAEIGVTGAVVGIITGGFALTGLGSVLPQALQTLAGGNLLLLLILGAVAATILGMGAPPLLVYVLLATSVAPALIDGGVKPLAAHMFIFYFGLMSMLTPPVALCSMIAARVANADFWRTSLEGCRLAIVAYIVPFFFVYNPALLFQGVWTDLLHVAITAILGVIALSSALTGYFFIRRLRLWESLLLGVGGLLMFYPEYYTDMIGLALAAPPVILTIMEYRRRRAVPASAS